MLKKAKYIKAFKFKELIPETIKTSPDANYFQHMLSAWDKRSISQVMKGDWFKTLCVPFAMLLTCKVYSVIGRKITPKLPPHMGLLFWRRYTKACIKLIGIRTLYKHKTVAGKLMSKLQGSIQSALDPLEYVKHIEGLSGVQNEPPHEWSAKTDNEKKIHQIKTHGQNNRRTNNKNLHGFIFNPNIPVSTCTFCKKKSMWEKETSSFKIIWYFNKYFSSRI